MADGVTVEIDGAVARVTLDRPAVGNALDIPMARALMEESIRIAADPAIRCMLLTGRDRLFCAGGDVPAFAGAGDRLPVFLKEITVYLHSALATLARMDKPIVTAVNGAAAGAGIGLAIVGDIVLAEPSAHFTLAYTAIGLTPDGGTTWLLPRLIGLRAAQELCLTNRRVKADEAARLGLVTRVVEAGTVMAEAESVARTLAAGATAALGATRRLLADSFTRPLEAQMEEEAHTICTQAARGEGPEGVAAFVAKRAPAFTGRV